MVKRNKYGPNGHMFEQIRGFLSNKTIQVQAKANCHQSIETVGLYASWLYWYHRFHFSAMYGTYDAQECRHDVGISLFAGIKL